VGTVAGRWSHSASEFRRFVFALAIFCIIPPTLLACFVITVDPYYVFGSPSLPRINAVRPQYDAHVLTAKPYQVRRVRPGAASLGSSTVEVGIDPRHPGWSGSRTFNFALPSSTSYEVMLSFMHAQVLGRPLKQAVVGLDFFGYNIFFARNQEQQEARFAGEGAAAFADFLTEELNKRPPSKPHAVQRPDPSAWQEALYLVVNADVAAAIARMEFRSGREHYEVAGRAEGRIGGTVPAEWDESGYLQVNPDVGYAMSLGSFISGYHHYLAAGRAEGRVGGFQPSNWDEAGYLAVNPDARIRIALGDYRNGYVHYAAVGRKQGLLGGFAPATPIEALRLRWPWLNKAMFQLNESWQMVFSTTVVRDAVATVRSQDVPAVFDELGMRVWRGQDDVIRSTGGNGTMFRNIILGGRWYLWLRPPKFMYCFTNADTGMTMFDPYRFMLRRAHAEGTDLRLYVTPLHAAVRQLLVALGLGERYEFWLRELVRLNEEEALRAGRPPFPLWDFSTVNTITSEAIPQADDPTPMKWFWEYSHFRKATGDLILDRILDYRDPARRLPADFGVPLSPVDIGAHVADSKAGLAAWAAANPDRSADIMKAARDPKGENRQAEASCW
jgi:hypothetical protein